MDMSLAKCKMPESSRVLVHMVGRGKPPRKTCSCPARAANKGTGRALRDIEKFFDDEALEPDMVEEQSSEIKTTIPDLQCTLPREPKHSGRGPAETQVSFPWIFVSKKKKKKKKAYITQMNSCLFLI